MRKVKYRITEYKDNSFKLTEYLYDGYFHAWHCTTECALALIEIEDGTIVEVLPCNIKFIKE